MKKMYLPNISKQQVRVVCVVVLGLLFGSLAGLYQSYTHKTPEGSSALIVPPPQSVAELVNDSDAILVGSVSTVVSEGPFAGYDNNGNLVDPASLDQTLPGLPSRALWHVDFEIKPDVLLKGNAGAFILREPSKRTSSSQLNDEYPPLAVGDRLIFFLKLNPDKKTYGTSPWKKIILDDQQVRYSDHDHTIPIFAKGKTAQQFIQDVKALVR